MQLEELRQLKKASDFIGSRPCTLLACSIVSQQIMPRVPPYMLLLSIITVNEESEVVRACSAHGRNEKYIF
jgi:hypothetical protein